MSDDTRSALERLAEVLAVTYLSQLLEYGDTDFFKSLEKKYEFQLCCRYPAYVYTE